MASSADPRYRCRPFNSQSPRMADADIVPENLDSIRSITAYVKSKVAEAQPA